MSRASYGYIAYRIPHAEGMTDKQITEQAQWIVQEMVAVLTAHGGELSSLENVFGRMTSDVPRIGIQSTAEAIKGHQPQKGEE